ncbi:MAG: insulinase family protein [Erysipelotrichaceae bacterium]|nr:insulinase family protein [Erysipelotrichaceae bacterium]
MKYIETKKFSDTCISVRTIFPLERETITLINLWLLMMCKKTQSFPTAQSLTMELSKTYGMQAGVRLSGYGPQVVVDFRFRNVRFDLMDEEKYPQDALMLMHEIMFCPILDADALEEAKYILKNRLARQNDDPEPYTIDQAMKIIEENHTIRISLFGYPEDIDAITLEQIQAVYQSFVQQSKHTYIVGVCPESILSYFNTFETDPIQRDVLVPLASQQFFHKEQQRQISQSEIARIYQTDTVIGDADYPALHVMNSILGQSPSSLLFTNIREKNSYCYSIASTLLRSDGGLLIVTGTQRESIDAVLELLEEQITMLQHNLYSDELLHIAKKDILDGMMSVSDYPLSMIEQAFLDDLLNRSLSLDEKKAEIMRVTKPMVARAAAKLIPVSQMILEGCSDE